MRGAGQHLDDNASQLSEKVDEVSSAVEELIRSVRDVLEQAEHLSGAAVDTSSSMEEMAASLREMDANASETARLSGDVVGRAEDGRQKVRETRRGMEEIRESTRVAQSVIHGLGGRATEIGAIVEVIDDVAEETNLLALNAAIIAAQAGEHGRSFTVVADEIKKLADRVLASTKEIEQVIGSVQSETANAIQVIERGSRVVDQGVSRADEADGALDVITEAARDSGARIAEIVTAVTEQTKAAAHVVDLMERVRAGVEHIRRAGQEQDRGNESMLASTEVMREIAQRVRGTTREQSQGAGRIADGVAAVSDAVERINDALAQQRGACDAAEGEIGAAEARTHAHTQLARELAGAVGRMREGATELRDAVERFRV
jgi:methyl-accepting chemotaxis protein